MTINQKGSQVFKSKLEGGCGMVRLDYWIKSGEEYRARIRIRDLSVTKKPYCPKKSIKRTNNNWLGKILAHPRSQATDIQSNHKGNFVCSIQSNHTRRKKHHGQHKYNYNTSMNFVPESGWTPTIERARPMGASISLGLRNKVNP